MGVTLGKNVRGLPSCATKLLVIVVKKGQCKHGGGRVVRHQGSLGVWVMPRTEGAVMIVVTDANTAVSGKLMGGSKEPTFVTVPYYHGTAPQYRFPSDGPKLAQDMLQFIGVRYKWSAEKCVSMRGPRFSGIMLKAIITNMAKSSDGSNPHLLRYIYNLFRTNVWPSPTNLLLWMSRTDKCMSTEQRMSIQKLQVRPISLTCCTLQSIVCILKVVDPMNYRMPD